MATKAFSNKQLIQKAIDLSNQIPSNVENKFEFALKVVTEMEELASKLMACPAEKWISAHKG